MNQKIQKPELSVVSPCYNEEESICQFFEKLKEVLDNLNLGYEIIFVDDGSTDSTLSLLNDIAMNDARVIVLSLTRNFGHQIALTAGLDHAKGQSVLVMDSDLQHPPNLIPDMIREYKSGVDIVYAVREETGDTHLLKRLTSKWFYSIANKVSGNSFIPGAADFRLMSARVVRSARLMREQHRFLRGMVAWMGYPSATVTFRTNDRVAGKSKYTWNKMFRLATHALFSFSVFPLQTITIMGILLTILGFAYLLYIFISFVLWRDQIEPGWPSILGSLLILGGVQLLSLGFIATYIGMIFEEVKNRPLYFLKQEHEDKN